MILFEQDNFTDYWMTSWVRRSRDWAVGGAKRDVSNATRYDHVAEPVQNIPYHASMCERIVNLLGQPSLRAQLMSRILTQQASRKSTSINCMALKVNALEHLHHKFSTVDIHMETPHPEVYTLRTAG